MLQDLIISGRTKYEALGSDYEPEKALGSDYEFEEKEGKESSRT